MARILVVDDEPHILQVVTIKLRNAGHEVTTAGDGEEALDIACERHPDLIITDFQMPFMTGLELCTRLATREDTKVIPIIILTARGYALDDADLSLGNIREVVSKPFSPRAILELVERHLADGFGRRVSEAA